VMPVTNKLRRVLILADESADWMVAGLRQLDRLALSLNEFQGGPVWKPPLLGHEVIVVCVFWSPQLDQSQIWLPKDKRLTNIVFTTDIGGQPFDLVLSTRLFLYRNAVSQLIEAPVSPPEIISWQGEKELWEIYFQHAHSFSRELPGRWEYITDGREIEEIEKKFLRGSRKSQDGFVSRYLNRPISRVVTRALLRFSITPTAWTLLIFPIAIAASLILLHGTYWSFLWGLVLFHVYSVLDGCDGEIARAKYLESEDGRRLDNLCDQAGNLLMVVCLGIGLFRSQAIADPWRIFYLVEGIVAAILIAANEALLLASGYEANMKSNLLSSTLYLRHQALIRRSGILFFGEKFSWWLIQMTKRDVALFVFVILAIISRPPWILHLLSAFALISLILVSKAAISLRTKRNTFASSRAH
jgi:phosphatidylglycerophosphate synthase